MKNKNLFIIFGTTSGIGRALYQYAASFAENNFILLNKNIFRDSNKNIIKKINIDLSEPVNKNNIKKFGRLFSRLKGYKNIYIVLNASIIEPIGPIGSLNDKMLLAAGFVNFLNYERIINIFISSVKNLRAKKKILAVSSGSAESPNAGLSSYCSTKAAIEMLIKCLFLEQKKSGRLFAAAIRPGVVNTNMQKKLRFSKRKQFPEADRYKALFEKNKLLEPEIVAEKIYKLLTSELYWSSPIININNIND